MVKTFEGWFSKRFELQKELQQKELLLDEAKSQLRLLKQESEANEKRTETCIINNKHSKTAVYIIYITSISIESPYIYICIYVSAIYHLTIYIHYMYISHLYITQLYIIYISSIYIT